MRPPFKEIESYLHKEAKNVLKSWIVDYPDRFGLKNTSSIRLEEKFAEGGRMLFVPDVSVYQGSELTHIFEVCHTNEMSGKKLHEIQWFCFKNEIKPRIYEIEAEYIMSQIKCPNKINMLNYGIYDDGEKF